MAQLLFSDLEETVRAKVQSRARFYEVTGDNAD